MSDASLSPVTEAEEDYVANGRPNNTFERAAARVYLQEDILKLLDQVDKLKSRAIAQGKIVSEKDVAPIRNGLYDVLYKISPRWNE